MSDTHKDLQDVHQVPDKDREILVSLRAIAGPDMDLQAPFEQAGAWLGTVEHRPPTLVEVIAWVLAHRGAVPDPLQSPDTSPTRPFDRILRRLAGDAYGFFGRVADRSVWPFDRVRSPLEAAHGPLIRLYTAIGLRLWYSGRVHPSRWTWAMHGLRSVMAGLAIGALVILGLPIAVMNAGAALVLGVLIGGVVPVNRMLAMPVGVAQFNAALAVAVLTFEDLVEQASERPTAVSPTSVA